jgi:hypothetical protein
MTMKLAKTTKLMAALLAASFALAAGTFAQTQSTPSAPAQKAAQKPKVKAAKTAKSVKPAAGQAAGVPGAAGAGTAAPKAETAKRDPFEPLINQHKEGGAAIHLPPGKAGLVVATVHVDGTIHAANGMIAIVSNPEQHVYFIREGDRLYDGDVEKIGLDGVTFRENSKDAFGKPIDRMVTKRIYASAGEQQ